MMNLPLSRSGRRQAIEWALYAATFLLVVSMAAYTLWRERRGLEAQEANRLEVQARVVSANLLQQFVGIDKALAGVRDDFFAPTAIPGVPMPKSRRLKALTDAVPGLAVLLVLDARGTVIAANNPELVGRNFAERDYFTRPRNQPDVETLYISRPFKAVNGVWTMGFSRVLSDEQGHFSGVVMAGLSHEYFNVILNSVLATADMRSTLVHGDGIVFLNAPLNTRTLGVSINGPGTFFTRHRLSGRADTLLTGHVQAIGEDRMMATRTIVQPTLRMDQPLVIHVSRELGALYAGWRTEAMRLSAVLAALMVGAGVALALVQRRRREFEALAAKAQKEREAASRRIRTVTDNLPAMVAYVDRDQRCRFANAGAQVIMNIPQQTLIGMRVDEMVSADSYALLRPHIESALRGEMQHFERHRVEGDQDLYLVVDYIPDVDADHSVLGFYVMVTDITDRKLAELRQAASEKLLRDISDSVPALIAYCDAQERCHFINTPAVRLLKLSGRNVKQYTLRTALGEASYSQHEPHVRLALQGHRTSFTAKSTHLGPDAYYHAHFVPDKAEDGTVRGFYVMTLDISALKRVERQLVAQARFDALTGLANRLQFNERLPEAVARAQRRGDAMAVMFLDIDHFKTINDTLGHAAGDVALKEFARRLQAAVRDTDGVARLAGDEFVVILEGLRDASEPEQVAQKILAQVGAPFTLEGEPLSMSASIGIAFHAGGPVSAADLLARADKALYAAKAAGRNTFRLTAEVA